MAGILKEELIRYLRTLRDIPKAKQRELEEACALLSRPDINIPDTRENRLELCSLLGLLRQRIPEIERDKNKMQALLFVQRAELMGVLEVANKLGSSGRKK